MHFLNSFSIYINVNTGKKDISEFSGLITQSTSQHQKLIMQWTLPIHLDCVWAPNIIWCKHRILLLSSYQSQSAWHTACSWREMVRFGIFFYAGFCEKKWGGGFWFYIVCLPVHIGVQYNQWFLTPGDIHAPIWTYGLRFIESIPFYSDWTSASCRAGGWMALTLSCLSLTFNQALFPLFLKWACRNVCLENTHESTEMIWSSESQFSFIYIVPYHNKCHLKALQIKL